MLLLASSGTNWLRPRSFNQVMFTRKDYFNLWAVSAWALPAPQEMFPNIFNISAPHAEHYPRAIWENAPFQNHRSTALGADWMILYNMRSPSVAGILTTPVAPPRTFSSQEMDSCCGRWQSGWQTQSRSEIKICPK